MKALKVLWGLLVDDGRLASILVIALIVAFICAQAGLHFIAGVVIWLGLIVSVWTSVGHQLRLRIKLKK